MMEAKLMVLLAVVATTAAGPITSQESDSCATACKPSKKFNYAPQTTYIYNYRVDTETSMSGASETSAKLTLETQAKIEVLSPCEFSLALANSRLSHTDGLGSMKAAQGQAELRRGLEKNALRFSYQDGVVDSVCGNEDPAWVMNVKKGLLSSFQNGMESLDASQNVTETDIAGVCSTEYKAESSGYYTTTIKKNKNILSCTDRHSYGSLVHMVPYKVPSELQSLPIMKTSQECSQSIENDGVLKSSTCTESHVYRPFSNGQSGGTTTIKQTLEYSTSSRGVSSRRGPVSSRDTLMFDHSASQPDAQQARKNVEQRLADICSNTNSDVRPDSPRLFSELVQAMKSLRHDDMVSVNNLLKTVIMCPENRKAYQFFLDALPMVGTSASVKMMTSLIISEEITGLQAKAWIASLAFVKAPESEMLVDVKPLLDSDKFREDALLPVSSMVNSYCRGSTTCGKNYAVLSVVRSLERIIGNSCSVTDKNFGQVLLALRGLGNAGHASRAAITLNKCLTNTDNPMEVRVAATDAFRRLPCDAETSELWSTFEDSTADSELKIASYLALMRCPSEETLGKMAASLDSEENDQVGAFVYSHLKNLKETSDPHKQDTARAAANLALNKDFDISPLKYSRNYEASLLLDKINTGFAAESNLVWSSDSQMPRSVSANLTVDLFGQAVNVLDFGGRLDGLEYLVKNVFGPYLQEDGKSKAKAEKVEGSLYGRIFGNELLFLHSKTAESPLKQLPGNWLELLIALSEKQDYAITKSAQFMDASMVIPTASGLPINIQVNGTGTVDLVLSGKMDLRKVGSKPRSLDIDGEIKPSAAVEITGTMSVDAFVTKTGLRMRNVLHSSTAVKGRVQLDRGQLLNMELDTPNDKMEVFSASSEFYILHNDIEQKQEMITENRKQFKACSGDKMATIVGMELCGEISFPNASMRSDSPYFPLTGPSSASLTLYKRDSHSGYKFFAKRAEKKKSSYAHVSFNTPGSKVDRAMLAEVNLDYVKQELEASVMSPWKKLKFTGAALNNKDIKSVSGSLEVDEKNIYGTTAEVKISQSKSKIQLNPMVELRRPGMDNIQLVGYAALQKPFKAVDMDLSLSGINETPFTLKGSLSNNKKENSLRGSFSTDGKNEYSILASNTMSIAGKKTTTATMRSLLKVDTPVRQLVAMEGSADYKEGKSIKLDGSLDIHKLLKKSATFKMTMLKNSKKKGDRYDLDASIKSASLSGGIDSYLFSKPSGFISSKTSVDYTIPRVAKNKVVLSGKWNVKSAKAYKRYTLKSNLNVKKNPEYNLGLSMNFDHKKKNTGATVELKYGANPKDKTKRILLSTSLAKKLVTLKQSIINIKANALAPEHKIDVSIVGKHQHNKKMLDSSLVLNYGGKGKDISAGVTIKDKSTKLMKVNGNMNVAWPGSEYSLKSDITQKTPKQYDHVLNFKMASGERHVISTSYKTPKSDAHDVSVDFRLAGVKPVTVSGAVNLDSKNFESSGEIKMGKRVYGISTSTTMKSHRGSANVVFVYPTRKLVLAVDGGRSKGRYDGGIEASWDADVDKSQKVALSGSFKNKLGKKDAALSGSLSFTSPFENFESLLTNVDYVSDDAKHTVNGKLSWGTKNKQIVSSLDLIKPLSLRNIQLNAHAKTPFKGYRRATLDADHRLTNKLNTQIKGTIENEVAKLAIDGEATPGSYKGNVALKTSMAGMKSLSLNVDHKCNNGRTNSKTAVTHNGKKYSYDLTMDHSQDGWTMSNTGDITLSSPYRKISTNWQHKNTDSSIKSTLTSQWAGQKFFIDINGARDLYNTNYVTGSVKVKSPFKLIKNVELEVSHKMDTGFINSNAVFKQNGKPRASTMLKYRRKNNVADARFELTSPFHDDITALVKANYNKFPMTGSAEMEWARKSKIDLSGSIDAQNWENVGAEIKITTPFKSYRNIVLKGTNKVETNTVISHVNLDYGVRKSIDVASHIALGDNQKMLRFKLATPFDSVSTINTGLKLDGSGANFDSSADFELLPTLGKYQASMNFNYNDDLKAKLRVDTPHRDYPYFELSTNSQKKGNTRNSVITAEYYPRRVYRLDTTYATELPLTFEATVNSPFPEYDDLSIAISHDHSPVSVVSHGEIRYQPGKKIEGDVIANWEDNVEGNLIVKTPFYGYEHNKVSVRHQGNMDAFASHGEVNVARQNVVADANYNGGYNTRGVFTFTSPIPGLENVEININKKGSESSIKGSASLSMNGEKSEVTMAHRLRGDVLKSSIGFTSPYTETFQVSLDHSGPATNFNNKFSINYGRKYDVDSVVSMDCRAPDVTGNAMLKYRLGGSHNVARLSLQKSGYADDMTFSGTASYNKDDISVTGSLSGNEGTVTLKTPFDDFRNVGLTVTHRGDANDFKSSVDVNYMANKHIIGKLSADISGLDRFGVSAELHTPFQNFESTVMKLNNNYDSYRLNLNGQADLITTMQGFGNGHVEYSKTGGLNNLIVESKMARNGIELASMKLTNTKVANEIHSQLSLKSVETEELIMTFDHLGELNNCNTKAIARYGPNTVSGETSMKKGYNDLDAEAKLQYAIRGVGRNTGSITIHKDGGADNLNARATAKIGNDAASVSLTKTGSLDNMNVRTVMTYNRDSVTVEGNLKNQDRFEGSIGIKTPVTDFKNVGMKLTHTGDLSDFSSTVSVDYMDNKNINGKVELAVDGANRLRFNTELSTPFNGFETTAFKVNNDFDAHTLSLSGNAHLSTTIGRFGSGSVQYSKSGTWDNLVIESNAILNREEKASVKLTNSVQDKEVNSALTIESEWSPKITLTFYHNGLLDNFNTNARAAVGSNVVSSELNVKQIGNSVDAFVKGSYNLQKFGSNEGSVQIQKDGEPDDVTVKVTTKSGNDQVIVTGAVNTKDKITGSLTVNTGFRGYQNVGLSFSHSGNMQRFNTEAKLNFLDGEDYSTNVNFYRYMYHRIETTVELKTPLPGYEYTKYEYRHVGEADKFTCYATMEYADSRKIIYDLSATLKPNPDFAVKINTPFENYRDLLASVSYANNWPKLTGTGKLNAGNGNVIAINGDFDASNDVTGTLTLTTPFEDFTDLGLNFQQSGSTQRFNTNGMITYMDGKQISGKVIFKLPLKGMYIDAELKTPFSGFELTRYKHKVDTTKREFVASTSFVYGAGKVISEELTISFKPSPGFDLVIKTPFQSYEEMKASSSFDLSGPKYEIKSMVSSGPSNVITLNGDFDSSNDIAGSLTLTTPYKGFNSVGASFTHKGSEQKFTSEGKLSYMDNKAISGKVDFYKYALRRIAASVELSTPFEGLEKTKSEFDYEYNPNSISASAGLDYNNGQKINGNLKVTTSPNYNIMVTLNTPFYNYRMVRAQGSLDVTSPSYAVTSSLNVGGNHAYSANGKLNLYAANNADGSFELSTPYEGMAYTKVDYDYKVIYPRADGKVSMSYNKGKIISAELKSSLSPSFDSSLTIKTPFYGYETLKGSATFDGSDSKYDTSSSLYLGRGQMYSMTSGLDYSMEPITVFTKISTPYNNFRNVEVRATHEGSLADFKCTGFFSSPLTKNVNAKAAFKYDSIDDMSLTTSLKSALPEMDDLLVELKRTEVAGEKKTNMVVGWTDGKQIVASSQYRRQDGWYEQKVHSDISLTTPFDAVSNMHVQIDHSGKQKAGSQKVAFELNDVSLLNVEADYSSSDKHEGSLTFTDPWPMQYSASASKDNGVYAVNVYANWNRDEMDSNIRLDGSYTDNSDDSNVDRELDISLEHSSRKMGVYHKMSGAGLTINNNGKIYWDKEDDTKISYELVLNDNSRRQKDILDGSFSVGLPSRTLAVSGSYSGDKLKNAMDATFSWDADRDDSKQFGVKTSLTRGDPIKGELTVIMPTIRKEISVSGEVLAKSGRVIFDTKTDISYSSDSRKTLTLTSRLEDVSSYNNNYNYSLALGVKHPHTNVDIQMNSHVGSSAEKVTVGMQANYLTAQKQTKNMALLAEINTLKRLISLQASNPMHDIEMVGDVVSTSPYKLRFVNRMDGKESFRSDVTVDSDKKTLVANAFMGDQAVAFGAKYPTSKTFTADLAHFSNGERHQDAMLAVRLNTSRLLHTRLSWNPDMWDELRAILLTKAALGGQQLREELFIINEAVAQELVAKYQAIADSSLVELQPVLNVLEREMAELSYRLRQLSASLREMYQNNDFYIQDMGVEITEAYMAIQERLINLNREYTKVYTAAFRGVSASLKEMAAYPVGERYTQTVQKTGVWINRKVEESLQRVSDSLATLDQALREYKDNLEKFGENTMDNIYNTTFVSSMSNKISNIRAYIKVPQEFSNAINAQMGTLMELAENAYMTGGIKEVYQQGRWAYHYWQVEHNIQRHLKSIASTIKEIVKDELEQNFQKNPITVWLPGEIQMEMPLPVDVQRLDSLEDLGPLLKEAEMWLEKNLPDQSTWDNISEKFSIAKSNKSSDTLELEADLRDYKPSRKLRKMKKGKRFRVKSDNL